MTDGHTQWSNAGGHPKVWDLSCVRKPTADLLGVFELIEKFVASIMDGKHLQNWGWCDRKQEAGMYFFKSSLIILMHPRTPLLAKNNSSAQSSQWSSEAVLLCIFTVQVTKLQWEARVMLIYNAYLYVRNAVSLLTILSSHLFQYKSNPDECHSTQSVSYRQTHNCPE